ncbi:MAG: hypothetical protein PGN37_21420 [Mycobacterium kyogaense]|uniref:hypothetical protein n=1 Tax=Mycobacterium kyogaense TaxID=2212479 RepID=UPI002FFD4FF0
MTDSRLAVRLAALASLGAAIIHIAVVPTHWQEWAPSGAFFFLLALFQVIWARSVLVHTTISVLTAGVLINAGALVLWAVSRTAGAPFGPNAGHVELIAGADVCAALLQIYVVMGAGWVWYRGLRGAPVPAFAGAAILVGAVGVVAMASTVGAASGLQHGSHHTGDHGPAGHTDGGGAPEAATPPPALRPVQSPSATTEPIPSAVPLSGHAAHNHAH